MSTKKNDQLIVEKAVTLSLIEVCLGSFLHTFRIPFSGNFLSLNQGFFLCRYAKQEENRFLAAKSVFEISVVVAILKSLAPAGKKLGPMMSISMQGFLFSIGTILGGTNFLGQMLSMVLLSLWTFVQPLITYFFIFGTDLVSAVKYYMTQEKAQWVLATLITMKLFIAILIPFVLSLFGESPFQSFYQKLGQYVQINRRKYKSPIKGALSDLFRPGVFISFFIMGGFFYLHNHEMAQTFWLVLRSLAAAFILFYLVRSPLVYQLLFKLSMKSRRFKRIYGLSRQAGAQLLRYS